MSFRLRTPVARLVANLAVCASVAGAQTLSGRVVALDGAAKPGVTVSLKSGDLVLATATSGPDGAWILDPSTSVVREARSRPVSGRLALDGDRRLHLDFEGRNLSGRRAGVASASLRRGSTGSAARGVSVQGGDVPDTLVYSLGERVFLRDTLSTLAASGIERTFDTTWNAAIVYGYLADARDGHVYRTVQLGTQVWMAQNLDFRRDTSWVVKDSVEIERRFGRLYQWTAAMDASVAFLTDVAAFDLPRRGICPEAWHLPSDAEWSTLVNLVDSARSGTALKALEFEPATGVDSATDAWGFRVMPGGQVAKLTTYPYTDVYRAFRTNGLFWTATEPVATKAWSRNFGQNLNNSTRILGLKTDGYSVRCVKD